MALLATTGVCAQRLLPLEARLQMNVGGRTLERTTRGGEEWVYQWPGIYFESHFKGNRVEMRFDDPNNNFNVLVDGHML